MKAHQEPLAGVQKQLYLVYARNKNLEKLLKLKEVFWNSLSFVWITVKDPFSFIHMTEKPFEIQSCS